MPFVVIDRVIIDSLRRGKGMAAVSAPHKHDISPIAGAGRQHARQHVNIVIRRRPRAINSEKDLPRQSVRIDGAAEEDVSAEVDCRVLIKTRCRRPYFGIGRAFAPELAGPQIDAANKKVACGIDIERAPGRRVRDVDRV